MLQASDKKVIALNYSGNVGKSTICNALLLPRIEDAELFRVESINSDGHGESEKISAINYGELLENIEMSDSCVVDVGSSNIETFISKMFSYKNSHEEIDLFVIPVTPDDKQISDTYSVYTFLVENGVSEDKIKFVLNRVQRNIYSPENELDKFKKSVIAQFIDFDNVAVVYESDY
ncbi:transcriptional regulator, partial [Halomonas sp. 3D7M]|uniref:transcriptional regulator n=1 Tax=Halomonas sp. 3D7M TaxID=2742617 RepID=UPI00186908BF